MEVQISANRFSAGEASGFIHQIIFKTRGRFNIASYSRQYGIGGKYHIKDFYDLNFVHCDFHLGDCCPTPGAKARMGGIYLKARGMEESLHIKVKFP